MHRPLGALLLLAAVAAAEDAKKTRILWKVDWPEKSDALGQTTWVDVSEGKIAAFTQGKIRVFDKRTGALAKTHELAKGLEDRATVVGRHVVGVGARQGKAAAQGGGASVGFGGGDETTLQIYELATGRLVLEGEPGVFSASADKVVLSAGGTAVEGFDLAKGARRIFSAAIPGQRQAGGFVVQQDPGEGELAADEDGAVLRSPVDPSVFFHFDWRTGGMRTVVLRVPKLAGRCRLAGSNVLVLQAEQPAVRLVGFDLAKAKTLYDVTPDVKGFYRVLPEVGPYAVYLEQTPTTQGAPAARVVDLRTGAIVQRPAIVGSPLVSNRGVAWVTSSADGSWSVAALEKDGKLRTTATFAKGAPDWPQACGALLCWTRGVPGDASKAEIVALDPWTGKMRVVHSAARGTGEETPSLSIESATSSGDLVVEERRGKAGESVKVLGIDPR